MTMRNILIATCGTSILTNARDIKKEVIKEIEKILKHCIKGLCEVSMI